MSNSISINATNNTGSDNGTWGELIGSRPPTPTHSTTTNTSEPATQSNGVSNNGRWGSLSGDGPPTPTHTAVGNTWVRISDVQQHQQQHRTQQQQPQQQGQQQQITRDNNEEEEQQRTKSEYDAFDDDDSSNDSDNKSSGDEGNDFMQGIIDSVDDPNISFAREEFQIADDCGLKGFALRQYKINALKGKFEPGAQISLRVPPLKTGDKVKFMYNVKLSQIAIVAEEHKCTDINLGAYYQSLPKGGEALETARKIGLPDGTAVSDYRTNKSRQGRGIYIYSSSGKRYINLGHAACELGVDINKINDGEIIEQLKAAGDDYLPRGWLKISTASGNSTNYYNPKRDILCCGKLGQLNALIMAGVCNPNAINHELVTAMINAAHKYGFNTRKDKMTIVQTIIEIITWSNNTENIPTIKIKATSLAAAFEKNKNGSTSAGCSIAITAFFRAEGEYWKSLQKYGVEEKDKNTIEEMMAGIMDETKVNDAIKAQVVYTKFSEKPAVKKTKTTAKKKTQSKRGATRKAPARSSMDSESDEEPPPAKKQVLHRPGMKLPILMEAV